MAHFSHSLLLLLAFAIGNVVSFTPASPLSNIRPVQSTNENTLNKVRSVAMPKHLRCPQESSSALFGIPKMFRWLTDQYPNINSRLNEGLGADKVVDNFYLDMNGIIHPCTHGNSDEIVVLDETAMFKKIFGYVDRLYKIVRPRKLLYLAVDGVAPRAKMNQQRSRRFRSSREAEELAATILARCVPSSLDFGSPLLWLGSHTDC